MSVYDNMAFGLKLRRVPKAEIDRRVKEAAEMLSIGHLLDRKPKALSGGQRQRVALGRAIVRDPAVFLMDEPLSNLDAKLRVQTRAEISKLHQRLKTTFIYVTHDQTEAMTMGSRIAVMRDGILQQLDTPQNLYDHPANMFVAGFIGSPAMNFFEARLERTDGGVSVVVGKDFVLPVPASKLDHVSSHIGKNVYFGIRPKTCTMRISCPVVLTNGRRFTQRLTWLSRWEQKSTPTSRTAAKSLSVASIRARTLAPAIPSKWSSTWRRCTSSTAKPRRR